MGSTTFTSMTFFNVTAAAYFLALFTYLGTIITKRNNWRYLAILMAAVGFLSQATGLTLRWYEAGLVEVAAYERAEGVTLAGWKWFSIFAQHPPWSNLYEIMVFMSYGLVLVLLVFEVKFSIQLVGLFGLTIALTALGLASLTIDPTIKPLVPALQSWWIMIHVISSVIGYSAGTTAAMMAMLFLVKDRVSLHKLALGMLSITLGVLFVQGRGLTLFYTGDYKARLMRDVGGEWVGVVRPSDLGGDMKPFHFGMPGVGILMLLAMALCVAGMVWFYQRRSEEPATLEGAGKALYFAAFAVTTAVLAGVLYHDFSGTLINPPAEIASKLTPPAPWRFHFSGNQWDMALFFILWVGMLFVGIVGVKPEAVRNLLPEGKKLDRATYNAVMVAFTLVAVVLVTGALWAHYAWGRYWGWDPKETGALVIWLVYAIYLHARITYGWVGRPSALIAVLGFFVILAGFLGVNLGWFADGLHSYGSG